MWRIYWLETKTEFLKQLRLRTYSLSTILFPLTFYCFFGLAMGNLTHTGTSLSPARYLLGAYGACGIIAACLYLFGAGVAVERGLGWLQVKRASPMPPAAYFVAKGAVAMAFGAIVVAMLFAIGAVFGGVRMPAAEWLELGAALVAGAVPFCALGLAIGLLSGPNSGQGMVNLIFMPMCICAGLWIPYEFLPAGLQHVAPLLPAFHLAQIALAILHVASQGTVAQHVGALAGFTLLFAGIARVANARDDAKLYG
jgi:ABC-2 type transport system permease protein